MQLSEAHKRFENLGVQVAAISYDSPETTRRFTEKNDIPFPILSDVDTEHMTRFGILNTSYEKGHRWYGIPHPGIFVVDANGQVFAKLAEDDYRERPSVDLVIDAVKRMLEDSS